MVEFAYEKIIEGCERQLRELLTEYPRLNHIHVAYSGGMDSHLLLLIAQQAFLALKSEPAFSSRTFDFSAIHVNHQLHEYSNQWLQHCERVCAQLQIPLFCQSVEVATDSGLSLEEQARIQRYRVFEQRLGQTGLLMMAHHLDDQMETMLMRLLKGAGPAGLAGIPRQRSLNEAILFRPLLDISRQQLLEFATFKKLKWIEDPGNLSLKHDRNYLRQTVLPLIEQRWPGYRKTWSRTAQVFSDYAGFADQIAEQDYQSAADSVLSKLRVKPLLKLDRFRQKNVIRHWLNLNGLNNPEYGWVDTILDEVAAASDDAKPVFATNHWQVRRFNGSLYLVKDHAFDSWSDFNGSDCYEWELQGSISLKGSGTLVAIAGSADLKGSLRPPQNEHVTIRFRQGGERCCPVGRTGSRSLKKLLNEYRVEPWQRDRIPLIYFNDQLAAVPNYFVCESYQAVDEQHSIRLKWRAAG